MLQIILREILNLSIFMPFLDIEELGYFLNISKNDVLTPKLLAVFFLPN